MKCVQHQTKGKGAGNVRDYTGVNHPEREKEVGNAGGLRHMAQIKVSLYRKLNKA